MLYSAFADLHKVIDINYSNWLKMSQIVAAVTLLSFANGAGDVISSLLASEMQSNLGSSGINLEVDYTLAVMFGSSLFCSTIIVALIIKQSHSIQMNPHMVYRDIGFCIFLVFYFQALALYEQINLFNSFFSILLYFLFVAIVVK